MRDLQAPACRGAQRFMLFVYVCCAPLTVLLSSCSAGLPVQREARQPNDGARAIRYSIVCVIHGDGDYLYHDTDGNAYSADEEALTRVKKVAEQNPDAEVFIFHQKPAGHFLFFFPLRDGEFYCYRNGRLVADELYWRDQEHPQFGPEAELYRRFRAERRREAVSVFLYCGHEIPENGGSGYSESYPDKSFTVRDFADGLWGFRRDAGRFDLLILSTCFGGTPYTVGALGSDARYIIASPDNLHLSYFDFRSLERMDLNLQDGDVHVFAKKFALRAFDRLTQEVQTAVSISVYDVDRVQEFLHSVQGMYDRTLVTAGGEGQTSMAAIGHCDCADLPAYDLPTMSEGVDVFYRPARFGRSKNKMTHSGWECRNDKKSQAANAFATEVNSK